MLTQRASPPSMLNRVDPSVLPLSCSWIWPRQNSSLAGQRSRTRALLVRPWNCMPIVGPFWSSSIRWSLLLPWLFVCAWVGCWTSDCGAPGWVGPCTVTLIGVGVELLLLTGGTGGGGGAGGRWGAGMVMTTGLVS